MEFSIQERRTEDTSKSDEVSFKLLMIENNELWKIPLLCFAGVGCDSVSEVSENYPGCGIQMVCRTGLTVSPSSSTLVCSDKPNVFSPQTSFREVIKVEKSVEHSKVESYRKLRSTFFSTLTTSLSFLCGYYPNKLLTSKSKCWKMKGQIS